MGKALSAIAAAAFIAAIIIVLPGLSPAVSANTPAHPGAEQPLAKGDRLAPKLPSDTCTTGAWPYYNRDCLFDARFQGDSRKVRVVTTDRVNLKTR